MANRYDNREHDFVLEKTAEKFYSNSKYIVYKNPNQQKNASVGGLYPDIVVCDGVGNTKIIDEIETKESVTDSEAEQWKNFSRLNVDHFSLTIPYSEVDGLFYLLDKHSISVDSVWAYVVESSGIISFTKVRG